MLGAGLPELRREAHRLANHSGAVITRLVAQVLHPIDFQCAFHQLAGVLLEQPLGARQVLGGVPWELQKGLPVAQETEVTAKAQRRRFTAAEKLRVLREADRCTKPGGLGALLRRGRTARVAASLFLRSLHWRNC